VCARIEARVEELGIPKARVIGALLDYAMANEDQVTYPPSRRPQEQEELPMSKAS
jgi:hypothetical protein